MKSPVPAAAVAPMGPALPAVARPMSLIPTVGPLPASSPGATPSSVTHDTGHAFAPACIPANDANEPLAVGAAAGGISEVSGGDAGTARRLPVATAPTTSGVRIAMPGRPFSDLLAVMSPSGLVVGEQEIEPRARGHGSPPDL